MFGAFSGFERLEDCYGDLTGHIHYCMFKPYDTPKPDYHRPEQFASMLLK